MAPQKARRASSGKKAATKAEAQDADQHGEVVQKGADYAVADKDDDEMELERLVLGDGDGFVAELGREDDSDEGEMSGSEAELEAQLGLRDEEPDLEDVADDALFFYDDAPDASTGALIPRPSSEDEESDSGEAPAWEDSDDDRLMVSLANNPRLRKLRTNEAEDVVSGREYTRRLRRQFETLNPTPEWAIPTERPTKRRRRSSATSDSSIGSESDMDLDTSDLSTLPLARLLQNAGSLIRAPTTKRAKLRPEVLDIQRTRDIPGSQPSTIQSLTFHPSYPVLLSSGPSSTLYMHQIAPTAVPTPNPQITAVHVTGTPIHTSAFTSNGEKVFFSGRRRYFHTWDLESGTVQKVSRVYVPKNEQKSMERFKLSPCGRYMGLIGSAKKGGGIVNILDANTTQWVASVRIEGRGGIADFAWWGDGEGITVAGKGGEVGEWSVKEKNFVALWQDEGAVGTSVLALGGRSGRQELGGDRWVVIGSSSGIVNIYDRRPWVENGVQIPARPEPTKRFMQLTTPVSCLEFSPDGQLLVVASRWKRDALRLVHLPSCAVYKNWPTDQTPFGRISAVAFSSGSDMLAVGNEQGKIRLWEIRA